jgi:hypothetical protein
MRFLDSVVPLFGVSARSEPTLVGSGFLVAYNEHRLLVTAAHVADEATKTPLMVPCGNNILKELATPSVKTVAPQGDRDLDNIDVAFWPLPTQISAEIEVARLFLPTVLLQPNAPSLPPRQYSFVGYPHTGSKRVYKRPLMRAVAESFNAKCVPSEAYLKIGASPELHIAIEFDHKAAQLGDNVVVPKDRQGMSGGPVFALTDSANIEGIPRVRVVGIAIEHHRHERLLLATKIESLLQLMAGYYDVPGIAVSDVPLR